MADSIDELYQLPLDEFTKARNALAKTLTGDQKQIVSSLVKPTAPAWAINQLYWKDRPAYKALIDASERLRTAHRAVLGGKKIDLRKPDEVHRAALDRAALKTVSMLERATGRVSDQTRDAIRRTLATLPTDEPSGRLTREPEPAGFSLFQGVKPRAVKVTPARAKEEQSAAEKKREEEARKRANREERERETKIAAVRKELAAARQNAERAAFNVRKAETALEQARAADEKAAKQVKETEQRLQALGGTD